MSAPLRTPSIRIKGHSGCLVRVASEGARLWVDKSTSSPEYAERLRLQIQKMKQARNANELSAIRIPRIASEHDTADGGYRARMEYLPFLDCLDFYSTASIDGVEALAGHLIAYLESNLAECSLKPVTADVFLHKLESIEGRLVFSPHFAAYGRLFGVLRRSLREVQGLSLPIGPNHGDLTLSNVMVASDVSRVGLFDFLDGYLESPLVDIAKLRQDTQFGWSSLISEKPVDRIRLEQIMRHTDKIIVNHFREYEWFRRGNDIIQAVNLLRIAPYARTEAVHRFVIDAVTSLELEQ
jgi:hypothetical protein